MFLNISNVPSSSWPFDQLNAAKELSGGDNKIFDMPVPITDPTDTTDDIISKAAEFIDEFFVRQQLKPEVSITAMINNSGDPTLIFAIIRLLQKKNIKVVYACIDMYFGMTLDNFGHPAYVSKFIKFREFPII